MVEYTSRRGIPKPEPMDLASDVRILNSSWEILDKYQDRLLYPVNGSEVVVSNDSPSSNPNEGPRVHIDKDIVYERAYGNYLTPGNYDGFKLLSVSPDGKIETIHRDKTKLDSKYNPVKMASGVLNAVVNSSMIRTPVLHTVTFPADLFADRPFFRAEVQVNTLNLPGVNNVDLEGSNWMPPNLAQSGATKDKVNIQMSVNPHSTGITSIASYNIRLRWFAVEI